MRVKDIIIITIVITLSIIGYYQFILNSPQLSPNGKFSSFNTPSEWIPDYSGPWPGVDTPGYLPGETNLEDPVCVGIGEPCQSCKKICGYGPGNDGCAYQWVDDCDIIAGEACCNGACYKAIGEDDTPDTPDDLSCCGSPEGPGEPYNPETEECCTDIKYDIADDHRCCGDEYIFNNEDGVMQINEQRCCAGGAIGDIHVCLADEHCSDIVCGTSDTCEGCIPVTYDGIQGTIEPNYEQCPIINECCNGEVLVDDYDLSIQTIPGSCYWPATHQCCGRGVNCNLDEVCAYDSDGTPGCCQEGQVFCRGQCKDPPCCPLGKEECNGDCCESHEICIDLMFDDENPYYGCHDPL